MSLQTNATFQRAPHSKEHPYAVLSRELIRDQSISPNCRWLLIYLLSMSDGWKVKASQIWNHVKDHIGRAQVYDIIAEAMEAGYMSREDVMKGNLKSGCIYYVSETPIFKKCFRRSSFRDTEPRHTENREALRYSNSSYEEKKDEDQSPSAPSSPPVSKSRKKIHEEKVEVAERVFVTESQEKNLLKRADGDLQLLKSWYLKLSTWKIGKQITDGKNDYQAITNWVIDAVKEDVKVPVSPGKTPPNASRPHFESEADNRALASQIQKQYSHLFRSQLVSQVGDKLEFTLRDGSITKIYFKDNNFKDMVVNQLRKMGEKV